MGSWSREGRGFSPTAVKSRYAIVRIVLHVKSRKYSMVVRFVSQKIAFYLIQYVNTLIITDVQVRKQRSSGQLDIIQISEKSGMMMTGSSVVHRNPCAHVLHA